MNVNAMVTDSEEFVYSVCRRSFLALWCYANPQGKERGKELCDILIVCEPDIVILSVKEIKLSDSGDIGVDYERWRRKAIEESVKQIYGAERFLRTASHITRKDGTQGLPISKDVDWHYHRVAVALGGERKVPFSFGDFEKGFVHVFDEVSFGIIVRELDTIADFVAYLTAKEHLAEAGVATLFLASEESLLALYLHQGRKFPAGADLLIVGDNLWDSVSEKDEFKRRKVDDKDSYVWDKLIEAMCEASPSLYELGSNPTQYDLAVRTMARENRFSRRVLGVVYRDFLIAAKNKLTRSRKAPSISGVAYVFVHCSHGIDLDSREAELGSRCYIARGLLPDCKTIIGISTEEWRPEVGSYSKLMYLSIPIWTQEDQKAMELLREETGHFRSPVHSRVHGDEFPESDANCVRIDSVSRNSLCPCGSGKRYKHCHERKR